MTSHLSPVTEPEDKLQVQRPRGGWAVSLFLIVAGFVAGLAAGYVAWGRGTGASPVVQATTAPQANRVQVPVGTAPVWGPENAPITIVEFSDYECAFCQKWHKETWPLLQQAYPNQIRLVYKDFPLTQLHPNASSAAKAARCSEEQGKYWQFHDKLFSGKAFSAQYYESVAAELGMDVAKWKACLNSTRYEAEITADYSYGAQLGISGTPTFFINGVAMVGAQPFASFKKLIDQELAAKK